MNYFCWSVLVLWLGMAGSAGAQPELDAGQLERNAERSRISAERRKLEADHGAAEAVCYRTFFANACRDKLRPAHTAALADLRRQEVLISEVERKISAADQLLKTEEKLTLQRQQQPEQGVKVQQDIASQLERVKQREAEQGDATDQAAANRASLGLRQANSENNALELVRKLLAM